MCGIAGYLGPVPRSEEALRQTLHTMEHRGPDGRDYTLLQSGHQHVVLCHGRLSIIDLNSRADQPIKKGPATLVFNGEIYNFLELRSQLEKAGHAFTTTSDTEVLLAAYLEWGQRCVDHLEGMWAFAIWDERDNTLFLSRDRFGEKPLYYLSNNEGFFFASEVKALRALSGQPFTVNHTHLHRYLVNGYKSLYKTEETWFKEVQTLPSGHNLILHPEGQPATQPYWTGRPTVDTGMTLDAAIEGTRYHLLESVKLRLRSDVPLAFCLSGGVDSAGLASIAAKHFGYDVATFSIIDKDERYDESGNIQATVQDLNCPNTAIELNFDGTLDKLRALIAYHDSPISTISYLVHSYLSEAIAAAGFKVAISGTAADELFTGYYDHFNLHLHEMRGRADYPQYLTDWQNNTGKVVRNPHLQNPDLYAENPNFRDHIYLNNTVFAGFLTQDFQEGFTEKNLADGLLRNRMMNELMHEVIPVILHEDDLNSMYYSVENRSPYLDTNLFNFAYSIPPEHLIRDGYGKYVLREALSGLLNDQVRLDRQKKGFNASIHSLIDFQDPQSREEILGNSPVFELVKRDAIATILDQPSLTNSYSKFLFNFLNVKLFLEGLEG